MQPDLSLYRRAWVNLLIAAVVDIDQHPDAEKFPQEALALVQQIRRDPDADHTGSESQLAYLEKMAHRNIESIKKKVLSRRENGGTLAAEQDLEGFHEVVLQTRDKTLLDGMANLPEDERYKEKTVDPWTIEGMYTDYGYGPGRTEPAPMWEPELDDDSDENMEAEAATDSLAADAPLGRAADPADT